MRTGQGVGFCMCLASLFLCGILSPPLCRAAEEPTVMTLSEGLKIAMENSRPIKIAARGRDISSADVLLARSRYLPAINASLSQTFLAYQPVGVFGSQSIPEANRSFLSYGIDVRQVVYDFGERSSRYDAASSALDTAVLNVEQVKNIVALDFIVAYFDLLETEKMELVGEREVERLASHLAMARSLYKEGVITRNDLLQSEVKLSDARQRLLTTTNLKAINASRLNNILSLPLKNPVRLADSGGDPRCVNDLDSAWEIAEKRRTELKTIDLEIKINDLEKAARRSEYFPRIYADGGYNYTRNDFMLHQDNWSLIMGLNINIFNGGSTKAELAKIDYRGERILEQRRKLVDDIKLEVEKSWLEMKNAGERIKVTRDAAAQGEENLNINKVRYKEGIGTSTDVLDAITLLTTAETNYYRAVYEFRRAKGAFMYAMGLDLASEYREDK